jgi:hypothetical protein
MSDTIIKNWFFVNLEYDTNIAAQVLGGIVVEDNKGRWQPGDYACTSKIVESLGMAYIRRAIAVMRVWERVKRSP